VYELNESALKALIGCIGLHPEKGINFNKKKFKERMNIEDTIIMSELEFV